jgi:hypothetical protein
VDEEREFNLAATKHLGEIVYKCFHPIAPVEVTSYERVDGQWIVNLGDGGVCTGSSAVYLVIVE